MIIESQNKQILDYLQKGGSLTPLDALSLFNCFRLGARIKDLRDKGYNIITEIVTLENKRFAKYKLIENE